MVPCCEWPPKRVHYYLWKVVLIKSSKAVPEVAFNEVAQTDCTHTPPQWFWVSSLPLRDAPVPLWSCDALFVVWVYILGFLLIQGLWNNAEPTSSLSNWFMVIVFIAWNWRCSDCAGELWRDANLSCLYCICNGLWHTLALKLDPGIASECASFSLSYSSECHPTLRQQCALS